MEGKCPKDSVVTIEEIKGKIQVTCLWCLSSVIK